MRRSLPLAALLMITCSPARPQPFSIATVVGSDRLRDGASATTSPLRMPNAVAVDASGNLYISDHLDYRIRKVNAAGLMNTHVGMGQRFYTGDGGPSQTAGIVGVTSTVFDSLGNLYLADWDDARVRKVSTSGIVTTIAGSGVFSYAGDGGLATSAGMDPMSVAVDASGKVYIADFLNHRIRVVEASGAISTFAGTGDGGFTGDGGRATAARIAFPTSVVVDATGNVYFTDFYFNRIRKVDPSGVISTFAGNGNWRYGGDGVPATAAAFDPFSLALDKDGNVYISDQSNNRIRKISVATGMISTVAGSGSYGFSGDGGTATAAKLASPAFVSFDSAGNMFIADQDNNRVRKVGPDGVIGTVAGTGVGDGGPATSAFLNRPSGVAYDALGNIYVADSEAHRIRKVAPDGLITTLAGNGTAGFSGDGGPASDAQVASPYAVALDQGGNVYIADSLNYRIRKISLDGTIRTIAGTGTEGLTGEAGMATSARIGLATNIAVDQNGTVYFNDLSANRVRKVTPAGIINLVAGNGNETFGGDGGPATEAQLVPGGIAPDKSGNLYIADGANHRIRKIDAKGVISTVAGSGRAGYTDGSSAAAAEFDTPNDVAVDDAGNLYVADYGNAVIRRITSAGVVSSIAGNRSRIFGGDEGPALGGQLDPMALAIDRNGNLLVADWFNDRIRRIARQTPTGAALAGGNAQTGTAGGVLPTPLALRVVDGTGIAVSGVAVTFAVTSGTATVNPASALTGLDGIARTTVTLGATAGAITVTATAAGLPPVIFHLTATPAVPPIQISPGGVVGSGMSVPPVRALSANGIATVFGQNFLPPGTFKQVTGADLVNGLLPTNVQGTCVLVGSTPAPLFALVAGQIDQINFQTPRLPTSGTVEVRVVADCGMSTERRSAPETVGVLPATPEFFYFQANQDGQNPVAGYNAFTGVFIGRPGLLPGPTFAPSKPGDTLTLYLTGMGATDPPFAPGALPDRAAWASGALQVTIGGISVPAAEILYAGVTPQNAGLYQLNVRIPASVPDGDQPIVVSVSGISSPAGAYITILR